MINTEGFSHNNEEVEGPAVPLQAEIEPKKIEALTETAVAAGLEKQDLALNEAEIMAPEQKGLWDATKKWVRNYAAVVLLSGASLVSVGCGKSERTPDLDNGPKTEQKADERTEKNREFLGNILENISGGQMALKENGDVTVYMGGKYYEVKEADLAKLASTAGNYRERIEREQNSKMKGFIGKTKTAAKLNIEGGISRMGHEISQDQLPADMKNFVRSVEKMRENPSDDNETDNKTTTSKEAGDFLK